MAGSCESTEHLVESRRDRALHGTMRSRRLRANSMEDVQSREDARGLSLDRVGVEGLRMPATVCGQPTVLTAAVSVSIPSHAKGTHMSRLVEVLDAVRASLDMEAMLPLLRELRKRLDAPAAQVDLEFPLFRTRAAPVSGAEAPLEFAARLRGELSDSKELVECEIRAGVTSLCPCSKAVSDYGAHNQRGYITIRVEPRRSGDGWAKIDFIDLLDIAEASASSKLYPVLKRPMSAR